MTSEQKSDQPLAPDRVDAAPAEPGPPQAVGLPTKLIRIASMTRAMLEEVRQAPIDEKGRDRLAAVHSATLEELREMLSPDLLNEFDEVMVPINQATPSEAELRIAQAQLIGWLEGLFHGIQASLWSQQMAAQQQLQEMQRRAGLPRGPNESQEGSGLYL